MLSASTDLPQVQSYHNEYFYSLDFALFINKKQNKGGESLPLAHTTLLATPSSGAKFILTQPRNALKLTARANEMYIGITVYSTNRDRPRKSFTIILIPHEFRSLFFYLIVDSTSRSKILWKLKKSN